MSEHVPGQDDADGIRCPKCHCVDLGIETVKRNGDVTRRRRVCNNPNCGFRFWTIERPSKEKPDGL